MTSPLSIAVRAALRGSPKTDTRLTITLATALRRVRRNPRAALSKTRGKLEWYAHDRCEILEAWQLDEHFRRYGLLAEYERLAETADAERIAEEQAERIAEEQAERIAEEQAERIAEEQAERDRLAAFEEAR
jgi:fused signal recognition particle receptor